MYITVIVTIQFTVQYLKVYKDKDNTTCNKIKTQTNNTVTVNHAVESRFY